MSNESGLTTRRELLTNTTRIAGVSALAGIALPHVHAAEDGSQGPGARGQGSEARSEIS